MELRYFQVDAFTNRLFGGNPAGVVPLEEWLPDETLLALAVENNLSETAFFVEEKEDETDFHLRWFTPAREVDLCGHATVATAHVLVKHLGWKGDGIRFRSQSGPLGVTAEKGLYALDFPARPGAEVEPDDEITRALGGSPLAMLAAERDFMVVYGSEEELRALRPDMGRVEAADVPAMIATAPSNDPEVDFTSRFFAPKFGIPEDPATGSAHCTLVPYWSDRLDKDELRGRQVSARIGEFHCTYHRDAGRVRIAGGAVTYMTGKFRV